MAKIFLSYTRHNDLLVKNLTEDIRSLGYSIWFDQELSGGQAWWNQILENIRECDIFIFALSPESLESVPCKREYSYAHALRKPILPVQVKEGVSINLLPSALAQIQIIDYRNADREDAFRLSRALTTLPSSTPLPNPLPQTPPAPLSLLSTLSERVETTEDLNYLAQSSLLLEIKKSLNNPEHRTDNLILLRKLKKKAGFTGKHLY
ncbi:MAG: toll/interleukin-1 receptor domain-containing protein [Cyanobacteria bacterium P01_E01_bin.48]